MYFAGMKYNRMKRCYNRKSKHGQERRNILTKIAFILLTLMITGAAMAGDLLKVGQKAPDFSLSDSNGKIHQLKDYEGKIVVLYFYPKDDTPGCTAEACNLRDNFDTLLSRDIVVLGVSFDDQKSHKKFAKKYDLPFPILSDTEKKVADLYGAKGPITGLLVAKRVTYVIGKDGRILYVIKKVDTKNHASQILSLLNRENGKSK